MPRISTVLLLCQGISLPGRSAWSYLAPQRRQNEVTGYKEDVTIRYDELMTFVHASTQEGGPTKWAALSIMENRLPRLVFYDTAGLRRCLENVKVRRKLIRFLRDNFHWPDVDEVGFYPDFDPYSFFFREIRYGAPGIAGGLILHNRSNMEKHTTPRILDGG